APAHRRRGQRPSGRGRRLRSTNCLAPCGVGRVTSGTFRSSGTCLLFFCRSKTVPRAMNEISLPEQYDLETAALKVPPHSIEAEQAVLGGLMIDNDAWERVADQVSDGDFYRHDHRLIVRAIHVLAERNMPFDVVTLSEQLDKEGHLSQVGGLAYLGELAKNIPSVANIKAYAAIIRERATLRKLISISSEIADSAYSPQGRTGEEILDEA